MMSIKIKAIISLLMILPFAMSAVNGRCGGSGICIEESTCYAYKGRTVSGLCPNDPNSIKCCFNMKCDTSTMINGICKFVSDCTTHNIFSNLCPGGTNFKCCV